MNNDMMLGQSAESAQVSLPASEVTRLYDTERRLLTLLDNLPGMAYRCRNDASWTMEFVSPGCSDLTGYSVADLTQGRVAYADLIHPDERERVWDDVQRGLQNRMPFQLTYRILKASGESRWVWEQGEGIYAPNGEVEGIEGFITDVTDRVEAHERLEDLVRVRTHELTMLLEISRSVALMVELDPLFEAVLSQIGLLIDNESIALGIAKDDKISIVAARDTRREPAAANTVGKQVAFHRDSLICEMLANGETVYSPDVQADGPVAVAYRQGVGTLLTNGNADVRSWIAAPLAVKGQFIGSLFVSSSQSHHYSPHEVELLSAAANQVAVAIENARLHEGNRGLAALEERQRLARELHDSVSQALYGIGLGARTARSLLDVDPRQVADPLDYVLDLADTGMAEMRALIFELRPESLATEGITEALKKHAAALQARHRIKVAVQLDAEPDIPVESKEVLYRIAQEAMHNVVKHAQASVIAVRLTCGEAGVQLEIEDDGNGFDSRGSFPGHLGLVSMRERTERLSGTFSVESSPSCGTKVQVRINAQDG